MADWIQVSENHTLEWKTVTRTSVTNPGTADESEVVYTTTLLRNVTERQWERITVSEIGLESFVSEITPGGQLVAVFQGGHWVIDKVDTCTKHVGKWDPITHALKEEKTTVEISNWRPAARTFPEI